MARADRRERHLSWELFEARICRGPPSVEPIHGSPRADMFIAPGGAQLGLRVICDAKELPPSPLAEVSVRATGSGSAAAMEVTTSRTELYREFYAFCCDVADRIQLDGVSPPDAVDEVLRSWASLLRRKQLMPEDKQVGLLGELWFLRRLAGQRGWPHAADAWRGPESEEHDFTLRDIDIEVKTTRSESRVHTIGSLKQLLPKPGRDLYVLSVQVTRVGRTRSSMSLPRMVAGILTSAGATAGGLIRPRIEAYGWSDEDAGHYSQEWELRSTPVLVKVDRTFPAIVPETLRSLGQRRLNRIGRVVYDVNVDGLGVPDGAKAFEKIVGRG